MTDRQKETWDRLWSQEVSYHWDSLSQTIFETIHRYLGDPTNKALLEAGSGTGKISLRLAMEGANVTLVDYSEKALENSRLAFRRKNRKGNFILSDIRNMDVPDDAYDLTWNAGVLEHFDMPAKVSILREMARVTKPDGMIVVLTPFAKCLPYRVGKAFAEAHGFWMYGQEDPIDSLQEEFAASGITLLEEFSIGFVNSLDFLDFIPDSHSLKQWIRQWYEGLPKEEQSVFPGYLLVSVGKPERLLQRLDSLLKGERKRVLDVGAAYGTLLLYSVLWGSEGFGVDMTDAYWSSELEKEYPIKWARVNIEAEELPWSESFDVILFTEVLEHLNYNPIPVFQKFYRHLVPGGHVLLSTPWSRSFSLATDPSDLLDMPLYQPGLPFRDAEYKYYSIDEIIILALTAGFTLNYLELYNGHILAELVKTA